MNSLLVYSAGLLGPEALAKTLLLVGHPASRAATSANAFAVEPKENPMLAPYWVSTAQFTVSSPGLTFLTL
jgi:hypothetical protein